MEGLEPSVTVLETVGLPLTDTPTIKIVSQLAPCFLMRRALAAPGAILFQLKLLLIFLLILAGIIINAAACRAFHLDQIF